jgi:hypothetical protein
MANYDHLARDDVSWSYAVLVDAGLVLVERECRGYDGADSDG